MLYKIIFVWIVLLLQTIGSAAMARPSKAEKEASRAAFWGLFAATYRGLNCWPDSGAKACLQPIIQQARDYSGRVDQVLGTGGEHFSPQLQIVQDSVDGGHLDLAQTEMKRIQERLIKEFASAALPAVIPDLDRGKQLYLEHCLGCHGMSDGRKGALSGKLKAEPRPLWAEWRAKAQMPLGVYAVLVHGVDDSEMLPMVDFMDVDEMWSIAFYVASLTSDNDASPAESSEMKAWFESHDDSFSLVTLTNSSDQDLLRTISDLGRSCGRCQSELTYLRHNWVRLAPRLGEDIKDQRKAAEARGLTILIVLIAATSIGFGVILSRRARVK